MVDIVNELRADAVLRRKIQKKLPQLFHIAELESSRAGKIGMEVGSVRERILVALFIYKFGAENVDTEIPITESEVDVKVQGMPISIKTLTSHGFAGVKLVWTVDEQSALQFSHHYAPRSDMLFIQINWENHGGFYYIPLGTQRQIFGTLGRDRYIKLPRLGTNPRGVEITAEALEVLVNHTQTVAIDIEWRREDIPFNAFQRWVEHWEHE
jgi:hypothetical protein